MSPPAGPALLAASGLVRTFRLGATRVEALRGASVSVGRGEIVVIAGPSGSGKTTLLSLLGALDEPDGGNVAFEGRDLATLTAGQKTLLRRRSLGFVFQTFNLVPVLSAFENVEYPLWLDGVAKAERAERVRSALDSVGLSDRSRHRPDQLSGGERQRVGIARALVHQPAAILADEPTASLDSKTGAAIIDLLTRLAAQRGTTFVFATHDPALIERAPRVVRLQDGRVTSDGAA